MLQESGVCHFVRFFFFFTLVLSRTTLVFSFVFEYAQNPTFFIEAVP